MPPPTAASPAADLVPPAAPQVAPTTGPLNGPRPQLLPKAAAAQSAKPTKAQPSKQTKVHTAAQAKAQPAKDSKAPSDKEATAQPAKHRQAAVASAADAERLQTEIACKLAAAEAQAAVVRQKQQAVDEAQAKVPPAGKPQTQAVDQAQAKVPPVGKPKTQAVDQAQAKVPPAGKFKTQADIDEYRRFVTENVRRARAEMAREEAAGKAQAAKDAAQSSGVNAHGASPSTGAVMSPTGSPSTGNTADHMLIGSTAAAFSGGPSVPAHALTNAVAPKAAPAPSPTQASAPVPASIAPAAPGPTPASTTTSQFSSSAPNPSLADKASAQQAFSDLLRPAVPTLTSAPDAAAEPQPPLAPSPTPISPPPPAPTPVSPPSPDPTPTPIGLSNLSVTPSAPASAAAATPPTSADQQPAQLKMHPQEAHEAGDATSASLRSAAEVGPHQQPAPIQDTTVQADSSAAGEAGAGEAGAEEARPASAGSSKQPRAIASIAGNLQTVTALLHSKKSAQSSSTDQAGSDNQPTSATSNAAAEASDNQQNAAVPATSQAGASISGQSLAQAPTLQGASALGDSRQDTSQDPKPSQTSASTAGLLQASTAAGDLLNPQAQEGPDQLPPGTQAQGAQGYYSLTAAATAAATQQTLDHTSPQQSFSGAVAGNQPAMPSQALDLGPSQDSSAASVASDSSDSTANSSQGSTVPATSNTGGLEWLVYNPPTTPGGSLLAALRVCLMNRH